MKFTEKFGNNPQVIWGILSCALFIKILPTGYKLIFVKIAGSLWIGKSIYGLIKKDKSFVDILPAILIAGPFLFYTNNPGPQPHAELSLIIIVTGFIILLFNLRRQLSKNKIQKSK
jgi:hypothetical protein